MSNVIDLAKVRQSRITTITGRLICLGCRHEWMETREVGVHEFLCPECNLAKGVPMGLVLDRAEPHLVCIQCQCLFFHIDEDGPYCVVCGQRPLEDDDGPSAG